ncbi:unnamed protein product [Malus baccata var. baccata]
MIMSQDSIPIIDMSNWNDPKVVESICSAAEKLGFFRPSLGFLDPPLVEVLENVKEATHRFFVLPAEEKSKYSKEHSPSKNVQYGTSFNPQAEKALEWKDFLGLYAYEDKDEASAFWPPVCRLNVKEIDKAKEYLLMGIQEQSLNLQTMPKHGGERRRQAGHLGRLNDCRSSVWSEIIDLHSISHEGDEGKSMANLEWAKSNILA